MEKEKNLLHLLDEEENEIETENSNPKPEIKDNPQKRSVLMVLSVLFVFLIFAGITSQMFSGEKTKKKKSQEIAMDFDKYRRGRLTGDIRSAMNTPEKDEEFKEEPVKRKKVKRKVPTFGKNAQKDADILKKYAEAIDPAAENDVLINSRSGRRHFVPGGSEPRGGVYFRGQKNTSKKTDGNFQVHNTKIKVKLEFSIRSTANSTVIAVVKNDSGKIPKGAKFYGRASGYVNKRTQIRFSKLVIGEKDFQVKGFAISGRDPGIESEVTDISKENIDSSIKQGLVKTASGIAQRYAGVAGTVAGSAASNTVAPASQEMNRQQEANKMTQEYRVPAGTAFFIYLE